MAAKSIPADHDTIAAALKRSGVNRRDFMTFCGKLMVAAPFGLGITNYLSVDAVAQEVGAIRRPSVIWLHMQECTGCTETLLRPATPDLATLLFDVISLDYHETVMAAAGADAEAALADAMKANKGKYVLIVEGSIPTKDNGQYLKIANKWGIDYLREVAQDSAAIVAIGSCASWGGVQSSGINPTGSVGVDQIIKDKPIINIPGCPPNPYVTLAVVLQYAKSGTVPELDDLKRPKFAFDRVIHEQCPRRPHFDAGRFAAQFGDENHRRGYCLYKLGCKGPVTHAPCSVRHFNDVVDAWPIGIGAPCFGCTEKGVGYTIALADTVPISRPTGPDTYPGVYAEQKGVSPVATGVAGVVGGAIVGAGYLASKKFDNVVDDSETKEE
ncbi:MAG TPA: hydrogenase small subunit [Thermoanaerobaculia bacterium]|nr:hydrogenase small subunit [Thermoanaerobaculia bacterium]